jgi:Flp pilus assembly protein TadG
MALTRLPPLDLIRQFARDRKATAAIGWAVVCLPFFALLGGIVETSLFFFKGQMMETAVQDASRLIMTGQAQSAKLTQAQFRDEVCKRLPPLFNCATEVIVDVDVAANFGAADVAALTEAMMTATPRYNPGAGGDIVVVRCAYAAPVYLDFLGAGFANAGGGKKRILFAVSAFKNEPFPSS